LGASYAWNKVNGVIQELGGSGKRRMVVAIKRMRTDSTDNVPLRQDLFDFDRCRGRLSPTTSEDETEVKTEDKTEVKTEDKTEVTTEDKTKTEVTTEDKTTEDRTRLCGGSQPISLHDGQDDYATALQNAAIQDPYGTALALRNAASQDPYGTALALRNDGTAIQNATQDPYATTAPDFQVIEDSQIEDEEPDTQSQIETHLMQDTQIETSLMQDTQLVQDEDSQA
jgi:hypothetical protein